MSDIAACNEKFFVNEPIVQIRFILDSVITAQNWAIRHSC
jgi:hypothetical protein